MNMSVTFPDEGYHTPTQRYLSQIQILNSKTPAFNCRQNRSVTGSGKVWRLAVYYWNSVTESWRYRDVLKVNTGRFNVKLAKFDPLFSFNRDCDAHFAKEQDAEQFLLNNWEFFV